MRGSHLEEGVLQREEGQSLRLQKSKGAGVAGLERLRGKRGPT